MPETGINTIDMVVIVAYLVGILFVGLWSVRGVKKQTSESYFMADRNLKWPVVGAALFASNISTIHLVGLAEGGYKQGLVIGNYEWMATFTLVILCLVFIPFYFKARISTLPEFLEKRYSPAARSILAVMFVMSALLIHIGISMYAGAMVFEEFFGINFYVSIVTISAITAIYTVVGGLKAVVVTETIQTVILLVGSVTVTIMAMLHLPDVGINSMSDFWAATKPGQLEMLHDKSLGDNFDPEVAWYGFILGYPILGLWYWCTDQTIVQRALGAKSLKDAQHGALFAGLLKILPLFFMVLPGIFAYVLFKDQIGDNAATALPTLITELLPTGIKGIMAAALLAALMSTIAAALNSTGTLVAVDIAAHIKPNITDSQQVFIGRVSAVVVMLLAMIWSTQGGLFGSIFVAINKMPAQFIAPPIATVLVWGVFWKRGTPMAGVLTLGLGFCVGIVIFLIDMGFTWGGPIFNGTRWISDAPAAGGLGIPFMMQAWWYFCILSVMYFIISLVTPPPKPEQVELTWDHPLQFLTKSEVKGIGDPRLIAACLLGFMVIMYMIVG
jgi:SSS family solute:Na+ symporter